MFLVCNYHKKIRLYRVVFFCMSIFLYSECQLRILIVVPVFPKIHDVCMLNDITGLIERGHDVTIYAPRGGDTTTMQEDVLKYNLLSRAIISEQLPSNLNQYDIVVFQLGHKAINIKKTHNFRGKLVVRLRGFDITGFINNNTHVYDELFDACDLFLPVCEAFKKIVVQLGCDPKKVVVQHSGIDCDRFFFIPKAMPERGTINLLSAGRFVEKKGFTYAIMAAARLIKMYPNIRYTIIGDGLLKKQYLRLIRKLGMRGKIKLVNWYAHGEYVKELNKAHIFIAPSVTGSDNDQEGIPNVIKEAMAMGLIVIATNHSGNPELIQDKMSGFLVPERSVGSIVRCVIHILNNPDTWHSMQTTARTHIEKEFDNKKVNDRLENIFLSLLGSDT